MGGFGQFAATSQFFLHGRSHFTKTGWEKHRAKYEQPDLLTGPLDLSDRVYMVTGANSGVGKEVVKFLASKGATVYMVCRSRQRAESALVEIQGTTGSHKIHILEADVGLEADVRRCWKEFFEHACVGVSMTPRLDGLVCNAGALLNTKTLTAEGVEATFASQLLFGTYLLGSLAMPSLKATVDARLVVVSSGGMYNFAFPAWEVATSTSIDPSVKYDGQNAYAYAKRGQVLLCEQWAVEHPDVKVVSCHPGWTNTPAVDEAYGETKKYLEPMRSPWEGAEGIAWLCVVPGTKLESGAFYLDRRPQVKHMAGPFFTEGSYTKNSAGEVNAMMQNLHSWANGRKPEGLVRQAVALAESTRALESPLKAMERSIDLPRFMGRWYVILNIPTRFDRGTVNNVEDYNLDESLKTVQVTFSYSNPELTKTSKLLQRATIKTEAGTEWSISPKLGVYLPLSIPYLIVDCAEDYSTTIIGVPDRSSIWIMSRVAKPEQAILDDLVSRAQLFGYDISKLVTVPQSWEKGDVALVSDADDPAGVGA